LFGRKFVIKTGHKPLKYLLEQKLYTEAQHAWLLKLRSYRFVVGYEKGKENVAADSLSRKGDDDEKVLLMITAVNSSWIEQVKTMVQNDKYFQELNARWEAGNFG